MAEYEVLKNSKHIAIYRSDLNDWSRQFMADNSAVGAIVFSITRRVVEALGLQIRPVDRYFDFPETLSGNTMKNLTNQEAAYQPRHSKV